jgi:hypothetical protein
MTSFLYSLNIKIFPMVERFDESEDGISVVGYRIDRPSRLDGICFTFEYGNFGYTLMNDMAERFRLYIHYGNSKGKSVEVYFKDGELIRGEIEPKILESIERCIAKRGFNSVDKKTLVECLTPPNDEDEEEAA